MYVTNGAGVRILKKDFIMLRYTVTLSLALTAALTFAGEPADTTAARQLQEVVISAPTVIRKPDMDVYYPSKIAIESSRNGMQLLRNLMIPSLTVNDALGSITSAGEAVQVRINGRTASVQQVKALLPETIKRVEWMDNPGLRYGGANYVLNFIVTNPTLGGSVMAQTKTGLNCVWGYYDANVKFNTGRSQWEIGGQLHTSDNIKTHRDYNETFTWPDGHLLSRTESPLLSRLDANSGNVNLAYSYIKPDTTIFYAQLRTYRDFRIGSDYNGLLSLSDGAKDIILNDYTGRSGTTPGFSAYLEQHLAHRQIIVADLNASLYSGHSYSTYRERYQDADDCITDVNTYITDRNQAYSFEADYIRQWRSSKLTAGASYTANRNRSLYENLGGSVYHQRQDRVYIFTEYFHRLGRLSLTGGLGAQFTSFKFRETGQGNSSWNLRPQATVAYSLNSNHKFRLSFSSSQSAPSLSETNIAPQQLDGFQWRIGNSSLRTSLSYTLKLRYSHNLLRQRINGSFTVRAFTNPGAITPYLYWDDDRLITSYENSKGLQSLGLYLSEQIQIIPQQLILSGTLAYKAERMRGHDYTLTNHDWSGDVALMYLYRNLQLTFTYMKAQRNLIGEKITWGEDINILSAGYNWKNWQFEAGILMPFGNYDQGSKSLCLWNRNEQHTRLEMRIPYIGINYNLQWGRQKRRSGKLVNADANVDHSTTGGR